MYTTLFDKEAMERIEKMGEENYRINRIAVRVLMMLDIAIIILTTIAIAITL